MLAPASDTLLRELIEAEGRVAALRLGLRERGAQREIARRKPVLRSSNRLTVSVATLICCDLLREPLSSTDEYRQSNSDPYSNAGDRP